MIFPIADLVPDICAGLSVRDIRALACVNNDVHNILAPFMAERVEERIDNSPTCNVIHYRSTWPRLHRDIKHMIVVNSESFRVNISQVVSNRMLTILYGDPPYDYYIKLDVDIRAEYKVSWDWYIRYSHFVNSSLYDASYRLGLMYFADGLITRILRGLLDNDYISRGVIYELHAHVRAYEYDILQKFTCDEGFVKIFARW